MCSDSTRNPRFPVSPLRTVGLPELYFYAFEGKAAQLQVISLSFSLVLACCIATHAPRPLDTLSKLLQVIVLSQFQLLFVAAPPLEPRLITDFDNLSCPCL